MKEKQLAQLTKAQLLTIILEQQEVNEELSAKNEKLKEDLEEVQDALKDSKELDNKTEEIQDLNNEIENTATALWMKYHLTKKDQVAEDVMNFLYILSKGSDTEKMFYNYNQPTIF